MPGGGSAGDTSEPVQATPGRGHVPSPALDVPTTGVPTGGAHRSTERHQPPRADRDRDCGLGCGRGSGSCPVGLPPSARGAGPLGPPGEPQVDPAVAVRRSSVRRANGADRREVLQRSDRSTHLGGCIEGEGRNESPHAAGRADDGGTDPRSADRSAWSSSSASQRARTVLGYGRWALPALERADRLGAHAGSFGELLLAQRRSPAEAAEALTEVARPAGPMRPCHGRAPQRHDGALACTCTRHAPPEADTLTSQMSAVAVVRKATCAAARGRRNIATITAPAASSPPVNHASEVSAMDVENAMLPSLVGGPARCGCVSPGPPGSR